MQFFFKNRPEGRLPPDQTISSVSRQNSVPDTRGTLRIPRNALWHVQRAVYLSIDHERGVQKLIEKIGVGVLRRHFSV